MARRSLPFTETGATTRREARRRSGGTAATIRGLVAEAFRRAGPNGLTDAQLYEALPEYPENSLRPRRIDLSHAGKIIGTGRTRQNADGYDCEVRVWAEVLSDAAGDGRPGARSDAGSGAVPRAARKVTRPDAAIAAVPGGIDAPGGGILDRASTPAVAAAGPCCPAADIAESVVTIRGQAWVRTACKRCGRFFGYRRVADEAADPKSA